MQGGDIYSSFITINDSQDVVSTSPSLFIDDPSDSILTLSQLTPRYWEQGEVADDNHLFGYAHGKSASVVYSLIWAKSWREVLYFFAIPTKVSPDSTK